MAVKLSWKPQETSEELNSALRSLSEEYPISGSGDAELSVEFGHDDTVNGLRITRKNDRARIEYGRTCDALRAVGTLLAGVVKPEAKYSEETEFTSMGIMLDCSRNAVMKVDHFKSWLRRMALMGFNMAMLYTEDTYEVGGEDYFGYMRGRYTAGELREIDDYAGKLGIEMIGCIQTLGHLGQILKWSAYNKVRDTGSVVLADEPETYRLIEKMIAVFAEVYRSRRIHVGMDEAHDLGRGRYLDLNGYDRPYDIFNRHLKRVVEICGKYGLVPMIWSDMYFRMGSSRGDYYDKSCVIPDDVKGDIPGQVQLVYWDYYHQAEEFYLDWIARHRDLGSDPVMGSGVWTWGIPWYGSEITEKAAGSCIRACRRAGLKEIFFTMWGDDGGYCDFDSALAGLEYVAELAYTGQADEDLLERRFRAICFADYAANVTAGDLGVPGGAAGCLWDDPLLGLNHRQGALEDGQFWDKEARRYDQLARTLEPYKDDQGAGDLSHAIVLAKLLAGKIKVGLAVRDAYARRDTSKLSSLFAQISQVIELIKELDDSFRRQWLRRNKPFGLEVIQIRLAGLVRRYEELSQRLGEFVDGRIESIAELDEPVPKQPLDRLRSNYKGVASASAIW